MPKVFLCVLALACASFGSSAHAEVASSGTNGFVVRHVVAVPASAEAAYRRFLDIGTWWTPEHTYTGNARNLSIRPRAGGCWCEKLPNGGFVRHMEVIYVAPNSTLRLEGGHGPLQEIGAHGAMTVVFEGDGPSTKVTLTYAVGGYSPSGFGGLAPIVDGVIGAQMLRYRQVAGEQR